VDFIPTGSIALDRAIGGGMPRAKLVELYGKEATGKTTVVQHLIANTQKLGLNAAMIDVENAVDLEYAKALGIDIDKWLFAQPSWGEQALEIADALMRSGEVSFIAIDSLAALTPRAQIEGEYEAKNFGAIAALMSRSLAKLKDAAKKNNVCLLFTNQMRVDQKGFVPPGSTYQPMKTYGGEAMKFYADVRIELSRNFDKETRTEQQNVTARIQKNKIAAPFKQATFVIEYGRGIDPIDDLVTVAVADNIIEATGNWYTHGEHKWHGLDAVAAALRGDAELAAAVEKAVRGG